MNKLRILIVDDEPLARERVRAMLRSESSAEIIGECGNGIDAVATMRKERPDVVFLDMQMPSVPQSSSLPRTIASRSMRSECMRLTIY